MKKVVVTSKHASQKEDAKKAASESNDDSSISISDSEDNSGTNDLNSDQS